MKTLDLAPIKDSGLELDASYREDRIVMQISGNADMGSVDRLDSYLTLLHAEAARLAITRADVDLRGLEFMSSSCFKSFITWLGRVQQMPEPGRYGIHFISNPTMHWQRRSLRALQSFDTALVTIEA
jgi:hypothetical protein